MSLQSPHGETLQLIDGTPDDLRRSALALITSGEEMERSANRLEDISTGTSDLKSEAIAKIRESAGEVFPDLRKAAIRYDGTGQALKKYSEALDKVQGSLQMCTAEGGIDSYSSLNALINDIEEAHQTAEAAKDTAEDKQGTVDDYDRTMIWEDEPTDEQKSAAKDELTTANSARDEAEEELRELWGKFDGRVSYWEGAYDEAVNEIEDAFDAADNDDKFLSTLGSILGWAALLIGIAAVFVTSPFWGPIVALAAMVLAAAVLAIEVIKMVQGDGDWISLGIAIVGLIPFGRFAGKAFSGLGKVFQGGFKSGIKAGPKSGFKAFSKTRTSTGRGIVRSSIKTNTKRPLKTTIRGHRNTKSKIRRKNREMEKEYQQVKFKEKNRKHDGYMAGSKKSLDDDKLKYVRYLTSGGATRHRELARYILNNSDELGPAAQDWAKKILKHGIGEDGGTVIVTAPPTIWDLTRDK
ncbi:hypothetical protein GCM10009715_42790 [Paeniglutamicibacter psychrophenolicus]|uniref:LXG domain-containing protein n=1 Tax=Paeniglutamicibacter psychrophenolicus TaxID=257454 RepID=A0ABS4WJA4_9MICC|nr:hypothetical protein [Paeniglutamicibacter psychrophenolicus]MBP2376218.1 hypothetical protein [Paeniglutamicibacter psychrophenolicus]